MKEIKQEKEERSPILKNWGNLYFLVIGVLILVIISLYIFMRYFK